MKLYKCPICGNIEYYIPYDFDKTICVGCNRMSELKQLSDEESAKHEKYRMASHRIDGDNGSGNNARLAR